MIGICIHFSPFTFSPLFTEVFCWNGSSRLLLSQVSLSALVQPELLSKEHQLVKPVLLAEACHSKSLMQDQFQSFPSSKPSIHYCKILPVSDRSSAFYTLPSTYFTGEAPPQTWPKYHILYEAVIQEQSLAILCSAFPSSIRPGEKCVPIHFSPRHLSTGTTPTPLNKYSISGREAPFSHLKLI